MHRGWIKQWRKEVDSSIWSKPPIYYKVWRWLLMNADRQTGSIQRSLRGIANEVAWTENNALRVPAARTMKTIFDWLLSEEMIVQKKCGAGNTQYQDVTICNWETYQHTGKGAGNTKTTERRAGNTETAEAGNTECQDVTICNWETYQHTEREAGNTETAEAGNTEYIYNKKVQEVQELTTSQETAPGADLEKEKPDPEPLPLISPRRGRTPAQKQADPQEDDWLRTMAEYWREIDPRSKPPYSLLGKWRKEYGTELPLEVIQHVALSGKSIKSPQAYLAKSIRIRQEEEEKKKEAEQDSEAEYESTYLERTIIERRHNGTL